MENAPLSADAVRSSVTIVTSDGRRNGKTLFAKLVCDMLMLRTGAVPTVFDTDVPDGNIIQHFPHKTSLCDLRRTDQQMALFDGILGKPGQHFVVDLADRHMLPFFAIMKDIGFEAEAANTQLDINVFYLIDRSEASVNKAADVASSLLYSAFIPVRNAAFGDALDIELAAQTYQRIRKSREIKFPVLSGEALGWMEHPDFHFDQLVAGKYEQLSFELKGELWGLLEDLYAQRESSGDPSILPI